MSSGSIGILLCMVLSFPLLLFPCRNCFHVILRAIMQSKWCPAYVRGLNPNVYFITETLLIVGGAFGMSVVVPNLVTVFGLTGAITGSLLVYILPAVFFLKLMRTADAKIYFPVYPTGKQWVSFVLLVVGLGVFFGGSFAILYQTLS